MRGDREQTLRLLHEAAAHGKVVEAMRTLGACAGNNPLPDWAAIADGLAALLREPGEQPTPRPLHRRPHQTHRPTSPEAPYQLSLLPNSRS